MAAASAELRALAVQLERLPHSAMIAAAKASKRIVQEEGARIAGADGLKGKKKRGLRLRARDTIRDTATGTTCRVQGSIPAWIWVNTGTRPHTTRRRKRGPLKKMLVDHPGTAGRGAWERTAKRIEKVVPLVFMDELDRVL
jgi:hypothetical protein